MEVTAVITMAAYCSMKLFQLTETLLGIINLLFKLILGGFQLLSYLLRLLKREIKIDVNVKDISVLLLEAESASGSGRPLQ